MYFRLCGGACRVVTRLFATGLMKCSVGTGWKGAEGVDWGFMLVGYQGRKEDKATFVLCLMKVMLSSYLKLKVRSFV